MFATVDGRYASPAATTIVRLREVSDQQTWRFLVLALDPVNVDVELVDIVGGVAKKSSRKVAADEGTRLRVDPSEVAGSLKYFLRCTLMLCVVFDKLSCIDFRTSLAESEHVGGLEMAHDDVLGWGDRSGERVSKGWLYLWWLLGCVEVVPSGCCGWCVMKDIIFRGPEDLK
jgi:hypothetical protein